MNSKMAEFVSKHLQWIAVVVTVLYFGYAMRPQRDPVEGFHYRDFGMIPVIDGGRHKPMDTFARTNLMILTHRQSYYDVDNSKRYSANKWLLDTLTTPPPNHEDLNKLCPTGAEKKVAWDHKVFRIENDQVLFKLNLKMREGLRYSVNELVPSIDVLVEEAKRIRGIDAKKHTLYDAKMMELWRNLNAFVQISGHATPLVVPNPDGSDNWKPFHVVLEDYYATDGKIGPDADPATFVAFGMLLNAYDSDQPAKFNETLTKHLAHLESTSPDVMSKMRLEVFFNEFAPFYHCLVLYVFIALAGLLSWLLPAWDRPLNRAAFASMVVVFVVHTAGLLMRMHLQERYFVFVTNLYSSAVFIGWGCAGVCLFVDYFYRNSIALVVGSVTGACTLLIAHFLSLSGDTMEMMQAVLDTNFWLATHVTCITLGYTAAFVAGFMGIAYVLLGVFTEKLRGDGATNLTRMTYGVLCFGMLFSFVGTVLGGIWADQSWGRFWGWDPKENGALLIVIWIALILHARWGGMIKQRGIATLSVLGNIVTAWSWFGTNFLGVGLHSYGFQQGAMTAMILVDLSFFAIAMVGAFLPLEMWQSFRPATPPEQPLKPSAAPRPRLA